VSEAESEGEEGAVSEAESAPVALMRQGVIASVGGRVEEVLGALYGSWAGGDAWAGEIGETEWEWEVWEEEQADLVEVVACAAWEAAMRAGQGPQAGEAAAWGAVRAMWLEAGCWKGCPQVRLMVHRIWIGEDRSFQRE